MENVCLIKLPQNTEINVTKGLVVVGANGSGKSRFGSWLEKNASANRPAHRISAQKSLSFPDNIAPVNLEKARNALLYGSHDVQPGNAAHHKQHNRWHNNPETASLNDYANLLIYLFAEENAVSTDYRVTSKNTQTKIPVPLTTLDKIKNIWEDVLPHRELIIKDGAVKAKLKETSLAAYNASAMSDGERVIFYLIGQCLSAPSNGMIIIDEPEIHLNKSLQYILWNKIERERNDCLFIYLTHDIDFAMSRNGFEKIWLQSFDGSSWTWERLPEIQNVPEDLVLAIYGARKKILLVEGNASSIDVQFYQNIFEDFFVKPCGSCEDVIMYAKSLNKNKEFHHTKIYALIDRDRRTEQEIRALEEQDIFVLGLAELENIFATPGMLEIVSENLGYDFGLKMNEVTAFVFNQLSAEIDTQINAHVIDEIRYQLNRIDFSGLAGSLATFIEANINYQQIQNNMSLKFREIINNSDYMELLKVYNRKSIASQINGIFGLKNDQLPQYILRLLNKKEYQEKFKVAVIKYLPEKLVEIIKNENS
jgi:ABC-type cobalamin/Fe3+-siderophores transport system ATPase subunit